MPLFFWNETLYSYTKIYDSLSPLARACVDLRIEGRKSAYIAQYLKKPIKTVKQALWRAKKTFLKAYLNEYQPFAEKSTIDIYEDDVCER